MNNKTENSPDKKHDYMMLSRYQSDLDYFFGWGGRYEKHLYFMSFDKHISEVKALWNSLNEKPEWLTMADIERYEELYKTPAPATEAEEEFHDYKKRQNME